MARIAGIDLPKNKRGEIGLTYIFGVGRSLSQQILTEAGIDWSKKVQDWTDEEQGKIRNIITDKYKVEGGLRSEIQMNIKRLRDIGSYRGIRHRRAGDGQKLRASALVQRHRPHPPPAEVLQHQGKLHAL